jgi:hypothetical protein
MNNKTLVCWTLLFSLFVIHHTWLMYQLSTSHAIRAEYTIAMKSQHMCMQSVELDLVQLCEERAHWFIQPFWLNIVRLTEEHYMEILHSWFDTFMRVCFENYLCAHGTICRYNVTKIIESMISAFSIVIPCILVALIIAVGKRLLSTYQPEAMAILASQTCPSSIWQVPPPSEWSAGIHPREQELLSRYNWLQKGKKTVD